MPAERNVHAAADGHGKGVMGCSKEIGMRYAEEILNKRREAGEMMEIHLRAKHVGVQAGIDVRAADAPDVVPAEFAFEPVPIPRVIGERSEASVGVEAGEAGG